MLKCYFILPSLYCYKTKTQNRILHFICRIFLSIFALSKSCNY